MYWYMCWLEIINISVKTSKYNLFTNCNLKILQSHYILTIVKYKCIFSIVARVDDIIEWHSACVIYMHVENIKRIFHGVMVRIGKVEPEG